MEVFLPPFLLFFSAASASLLPQSPPSSSLFVIAPLRKENREKRKRKWSKDHQRKDCEPCRRVGWILLHSFSLLSLPVVARDRDQASECPFSFPPSVLPQRRYDILLRSETSLGLQRRRVSGRKAFKIAPFPPLPPSFSHVAQGSCQHCGKEKATERTRKWKEKTFAYFCPSPFPPFSRLTGHTSVPREGRRGRKKGR